MKTRKEVKKHVVRTNPMGQIVFLKITYTDDSISYGCSTPGCLALFGPEGREQAWKEATEYPQYGDPGWREALEIRWKNRRK